MKSQLTSLSAHWSMVITSDRLGGFASVLLRTALCPQHPCCSCNDGDLQPSLRGSENQSMGSMAKNIVFLLQDQNLMWWVSVCVEAMTVGRGNISFSLGVSVRSLLADSEGERHQVELQRQVVWSLLNNKKNKHPHSKVTTFFLVWLTLPLWSVNKSHHSESEGMFYSSNHWTCWLW